MCVLRSVIEVTDWMRLGLSLQLPPHELDRIKRNWNDETDRLQNVVSLWLDTGNASWRALVVALIDPLMNKVELALRISKEHPLLAAVEQ